MPNPINESEVHAYVTNFYVVPEMRSHGLGRKLLSKALSWSRAEGVDAIILWASPGSRSLYRRCGSGSLPIFSNCGTLRVEPGRGTSEI